MNYIHVCDDFLDSADARDMRLDGCNSHYPEGGVEHDGAVYPGMCLTMEKAQESLMGPILSRILGGTVTFNASFYRCMKAGINTRQGHDFRVHYDSAFGEYACILYLSEPGTEFGGTAFWKHRKTGDNHVNANNQAMLDNDLARADAWSLESRVGMRYNRATIYPASAIHSAYPQDGWGDTSEDARLIWTALLSVEGEPNELG